MLADSLTVEHFTEHDIASLRKTLLQLLLNEDHIGEWTDKVEVRQTGCSIHIKYGKKVPLSLDGTDPSSKFVAILLNATNQLGIIIAKLLEVDEDDWPALLEEAKRG